MEYETENEVLQVLWEKNSNRKEKKKIVHLHKELRPVTTFLPPLLIQAISTEVPNKLKHNHVLIFLFLCFDLYFPCPRKHPLLTQVSSSFSECHRLGTWIFMKTNSNDCCYIMFSIVPLKQSELSRDIRATITESLIQHQKLPLFFF